MRFSVGWIRSSGRAANWWSANCNAMRGRYLRRWQAGSALPLVAPLLGEVRRGLAEHGDGLAQRHEITALTPLRLGGGLPRLRLRRRQLVAQPGILGLELHDTADALEVHPL